MWGTATGCCCPSICRPADGCSGSCPPSLWHSLPLLTVAAARRHIPSPQVPGHVQKFAGQHWRPEQLRSRFMNWLHDYKIKVGGCVGTGAVWLCVLAGEDGQQARLLQGC